MPTPNGSGSKFPHGVHVGTHLELDNLTSAPAVTTNKVYFLNGVLTADGVNLEGGGSGGSSLDSAYNSGRTITVDDGAVILAGTDEDTAVLSITGDGDSAGALISLSHTTTSRNDILGSSSNWSVTGAGAATFTQVNLGDDQAIRLGATQDATLQWVNASSYAQFAGAIDFTGNITTSSNATIVHGGVAGSDVFTITAGDAVMSDGSLAITDADNAETVTIINNTATTLGAAASAGVVQVESTSLTTGAAVNVQLTEGTLNGGFYYSAWDATAGARVFSVAENGDITVTGTAGSAALTLSNGDVTMGDGSITVTDADNAATLSVTNNTATSASVFVLAGSGAFTGSTTTSFLTLTASGLTSGTVLYAPAAALTTGKVAHIVTNAISSGKVVHITATSPNAMTTGELLTLDHSSGNITGTLDKTGALASILSDRTVTTGTVSDNYDAFSVIRGSTINGAGSFTAAGSVARFENQVTNTSGTVSDTTIGLEVVMDSLGTGAGLSITHSAVSASAIDIVSTATTTGKAIDISDLNALTSGIGIHLASSATAIATTGRLLYSSHSGTTSTSGVLNEFATAATDETILFRLTASAALAAGKVLDVVAASATTSTVVSIEALDALTTGIGLVVESGATAITGAGRILRIDHTGTTSTSGVMAEFATAATDETVLLRLTASAALAAGKVLDIAASSATTTTVVSIEALDALTTGIGLVVESGATAITGAGRILRIDHTGTTSTSGVLAEFASAATDETVILRVTASAALAAGVVLDLVAGSLTTGTVLDLSGLNALTTGSAIVINSNSSDASARNLLNIVNDNTAATGTIPLRIQQDAPQSTNYWEVANFVTTSGTVTLWVGNGTAANGNLSGTAGDVIFNGASNGVEYCTGTTNWTAA